jgi:hypothetical protein
MTKIQQAQERAARMCEDEICACCWDEDAKAAAEHIAATIRAADWSDLEVQVPEKTVVTINDFEQLQEYLLGSGPESAENFMIREIAVRDLIDEVKALRRGIGFNHVKDDPVLYLEDKFTGISTREFAEYTLSILRQSRERENK